MIETKVTGQTKMSEQDLMKMRENRYKVFRHVSLEWSGQTTVNENQGLICLTRLT